MWLLIAGVLVPQEFASSAIVFIIALQNNFPIWEIHLIWLCITSLDMYVGYMLGKFTQEKFHGTRFFNWVERWVARGRAELGPHGEKLSLALLAGNFAWYLFLWGTVLGLSSFISNPDIIILILVVAGILSHFLFKLSKSNGRSEKR
jgi:hypothetical protein